MDALSIIFGSKQQNQSSIKTLNDTVSQMGIDDISFISMKGYKWFDGFCIEGDIILKKGNVKIEQKFKATDFVDLFNQIVLFCENM